MATTPRTTGTRTATERRRPQILRKAAQLFQKKGFHATSMEEVANEVRSTGFFNNKSKSIIGAAKKIVGEFGGKVPRTLEELITVPGAAIPRSCGSTSNVVRS